MRRKLFYLLIPILPLIIHQRINYFYSALFWRYSIKFWPISIPLILALLLILYLSTLGIFRRAKIEVNYYLAIPLGMMFFGTLSFLIGFLSASPSIRVSAFLVVPSIYLAFRKGGEVSKKDLLPFLYFCMLFIPFLLLRASFPSAYYNYGESLMDLAYLSSSIRANSLPLYDPWLSGFHANYYYYGHFMWGSLSMLSYMPPEYCVNVGAALIMAMTFSSSYGFLKQTRVSKFLSLLGASFITLAANPYTFSVLLKYLFEGKIPSLKDPWSFYSLFWHLAPAYLIKGATVHTPAIDFFQREFHENFVVIPYFISYLGLINGIRRARRSYYLILPFLGAFFPFDSWALPIALIYTWGTLGLRSLVWSILSGIPFIPYYLSLKYKPGIGIIPPKCPIPPTSFIAFLTIFAAQLLIIFAYIGLVKRKRKVNVGIVVSLIGGILFAFTRYHALLFTLPAIAYFAIKKDEERELRFLTLVPLIFLSFCEFFFVKDIYSINGYSQYSRFNTIFKIYEPSWIMLSLASFLIADRGMGKIGKNRKRFFKGIFVAFIVIVLISEVYFPFGFMGTKFTPYGFDGVDKDRFTLNSVSYVKNLDGIYFLREQPFGVIIEGVGSSPSFSYSPYGRVSAITGMPTILGWGGHEETWRGGNESILKELSNRYYEIKEFYLNPTEKELCSLFQKYHVRYIFFGKLEMRMISNFGGDPQSSLEKMKNLSGLKLLGQGSSWYVFEVVPSMLSSRRSLDRRLELFRPLVDKPLLGIFLSSSLSLLEFL